MMLATKPRGLTANEIATIVGIDYRSVHKRVTDDFVVGQRVEGKGRPIKIYSMDCLQIWGIKQEIEAVEKVESLRATRTKTEKEIYRQPKSLPISERISLENIIVNSTKTFYLSQSLKNNVLECLRIAINKHFLNRPLPDGTTIDSLINYYYKQRIMRKDKYGVGYYYTEGWENLWVAEFQKNQHNSKQVKNRWSPELFETAEIAGEGFGAGELWAIDGTKLDIYTKFSDGKIKFIGYFCIMDVLTGYPLHIEAYESESAVVAIEALAKCIVKYGVPKFGIILDNGPAFKSKMVQGFIRFLYSDDDYENFSKWQWHKHIFGKQNEAFKYPLPSMPNFFGKAKLERMFDEHNRSFGSLHYPTSYLPTAHTRMLSQNIGTVPALAQKKAPNFSELWQNFNDWIYNDYVNRPLSDSYKFLCRRLKRKLTIRDAFEYYGSEYLPLRNPPMENMPQLVYYSTSKENRHTIRPRSYGTIAITHKGNQYNYQLSAIDHTLLNRKITAIPVDDCEKAHIYLEYEENYYDNRTPEAGSIFYLGLAHDATIRNVSDLKTKIVKRQNAQKEIDLKIDKEIKSVKSKRNQLYYSEQRVIDNKETKLISESKNDDDIFDFTF